MDSRPFATSRPRWPRSPPDAARAATPAEELQSARQARAFASGLAKGQQAGDWARPGAGATLEALSAWAHRDAIRTLGETLRTDGPGWACEAAADVDRATKIGNSVLDDVRERIVLAAVGHGADAYVANLVVDRALELSGPELVTTVNAVCDVAHQL